MICRIDREKFREAWDKIQLPDKPYRPEGIIRIEADNGSLRLEGPHGSAEVAAEIEQRGVLFMPFDEFIGGTGDMLKWNEDTIYFEAHADRIRGDGLGFLCDPTQFAVFRDPATAPRTWAPAPPPEDNLEDQPDSSAAPA